MGGNLSGHLDIDSLILCNVNQFHGIEIDPSAVQIATLALWLTDHQMNLKMKQLGQYFTRIPLKQKANIVCTNALQIDWTVFYGAISSVTVYIFILRIAHFAGITRAEVSPPCIA